MSAISLAQSSPATKEFQFDISRTSRLQALQELSRQADGLLLGYLLNNSPDEKALVGPVKGKYTIDAALSLLLASSSLTSRWIGNTMVSIEPRPAGTRSIVYSIAKGEPTPSREIGSPRELEQVVVTAQPVLSLFGTVAPVTIMERDSIDASGATTMAEMLKYISQNAFSRPESYRASGAQYAEMRGLGPDTTLVLINGRRTLPSVNSLNSDAFDLNTVPLTAVERIELLVDPSVVAYGTDAIGGIVINIVLRKKVPRPSLSLGIGGAEGGAEHRRITWHEGMDREGASATVMVDYFDLQGLSGARRDRWRDQNFRRFGSIDRRSLPSNPGNIVSANGDLLPGLSSTFASVPVSSTNDIDAGSAAFHATAGERSLDSLLKYSSIVPESTRLAMTAMASLELAHKVSASAELIYVDRDTTYYFSAPLLQGEPVAASNAFNPFGTPVLSHRLLTEFGLQNQHTESKWVRAVGALSGEWQRWNWELAVLNSSERAFSRLENQLDMSLVRESLASSDPNLALDVFHDGPVGSAALLNSLRVSRDVYRLDSIGTQLSASAQRPMIQLPAGPLSALVGGEWRQESMQFQGPGGEFEGARNISAGFLQLRIPLVSAAMDWPAVQSLMLSTGTRVDRFGDSDAITRSQLGLSWRLLPSLALHASGGSRFRPPSFHELYLPTVTSVMRVIDPVRNEVASVMVSAGGNSALQSSTGRSFTVGVEFTPDTAMNWRVSADYWRIAVRERVVAPQLALLLANEQRFANRIVRGVRTEADIQAGLPGALLAIDTSRINAGSTKVSGVDLAISANWQTAFGAFRPSLFATWCDQFVSTDLPGQAAVDRVNVASELGSILRWRAILSLGWKRGRYGMMLMARHTPSYGDAIGGVPNGRRIPAQTLFDLQTSLDLKQMWGGSLSDGLEMTLGVANLFDVEPAFAEVGGVAGFDLSQGDLKQRTFHLGIEKTF